jgi:hypothetical protein
LSSGSSLIFVEQPTEREGTERGQEGREGMSPRNWIESGRTEDWNAGLYERVQSQSAQAQRGERRDELTHDENERGTERKKEEERRKEKEAPRSRPKRCEMTFAFSEIFRSFTR